MGGGKTFSMWTFLSLAGLLAQMKQPNHPNRPDLSQPSGARPWHLSGALGGETFLRLHRSPRPRSLPVVASSGEPPLPLVVSGIRSSFPPDR